ncbi:3-hydroxyacyl-ACP dehydratase [Chitinophaga pendula]|uniref:3-hydroxyacyl-ACP dehydratase n=1 Tax=Chitinophaga TaxID=79328 RepID=UPI000BAFE2BB|nr:MULTISPECIES: 3-hydroxyacyl-ACP dehydratase [Chitinophaga]ASZ11470.1 3-hydroxyacyl-ACP dehydratase [Chitinophaga sp. MD30]UCJ05519.1 3-hydroxyacyl-ACP dehydratase [Chitinophaga pendula]
MLAGTFYTIVQEHAEEGQPLRLSIALNAAHPIFEGHFPGQPVVPGVCMMQTIQELLERKLERKLQLKKANSMKFLNAINPLHHPEVAIELQHTTQEDGTIKVNALLKSDPLTFMKFQGVFKNP